MPKHLPNRKSIRLKGYDYSQPGLYFVTICAYGHECIFGEIENGEMILNDYGLIAHNCWLETERIRPNITLDVFIVMPNHVHAIIQINDEPHLVGATCGSPEKNESGSINAGNPRNKNTGNPQVAPARANGPKSGSVGAILGGYKSMVTRRINQLRNTPGRSVWHVNYHDHIIRHERAYLHISEYIINNPRNWNNDRFFR